MKPIITLLALLMATFILPGVGFAEKAAEPDKSASKASEEDAPKKTEKELAEEWIISFMVKNSPPGRKTYYVDAQETKEDALTRYKSIAEDIVEVVYSPNTPVVFGGDHGRARTITVILGIMFFESGFGKHVDYNIGKFARGDNGNSFCMMQMNVGTGRTWKGAGGWNIKHHRPWRYGDKKADIVLGATGPEMIADRRKCITEGLRLIRISFRSCRKRPLKEKLLVYASGKCDPTIKAAVKGSRLRMTAAIKFWKESKVLWSEFADEPVKKQVVAMLADRAEKAAQLAAAEKKKAKKEAEKKAEADKEKKPQAKKEPEGGSAKKSEAADQS